MLLDPKDVQQVSNDIMNMLHAEELEIINNFYDAVVAEDIDKITEFFPVVAFDVEDHFSTEEEMMEQSKFYAAPIHKAEHDTLRGKLKDVAEDWEKNKNPAAVRTFLEDDFKHWMVLHVARWDAETAMHIGDNA